MDEFIIELQAKIDEASSKKNINKTDIPNLQKQLDKLKLQATIDENSIKKTVRQLENITEEKIVISNIGIDAKSTAKAGQDYVKQLSQGVSQGIKANNSVLASFKNSLKDIGMGSKEIDAVANKINNLGVQIETLSQTRSAGKKDILSVNIAGIDQYGQAIKLTQQYNASTGELIKNIDNVSTIQQKAATSLKNIATTKIDEENKLESFVQKMEQSGHYTDDLKSKISQLKAELSDVFDSESLINYLNKVGNLQSEFQKTDAIAKTKEKSTNLQTNVDAEKKILQAYTTDLKEAGVLTGNVKENIQEMFYSLSKVGSQTELTTWRAKLKGIKAETDAVLKSVSQLSQKKIDEIQLSMDNGHGASDYQNRINSIIASLEKYGVETQEAKNLTASLQSTFESMKGMSGQELISQAEKLEQEFKSVKASVAQAKLAYDKYMHPVTNEKASTLINRINSFLTKNTKITKEAKTELEGYVQELKNGVNLRKWDEINGKLKTTENSMRMLHRLGASLKDQMAQAAQNFSQWLSISSSIMLVVSKTKNAISDLKKVDTLLTEISKANDRLSKSDLQNIGNNSFTIASKYGKTATDYLSGVQEASRAGYENAMGIAELSVAAQGAGDMTAELANQYIIATDKAYKLGGSVEELTEVLDGSNYITNHNAVNMTELAEGMSIVGSQAASLGVEVNEATAVLGTMIATTQQSGSEMARAFKAILLNLQQVTDEEEGIDAEGLTKYEEACKALNVSLKETKNGITSLRDPMEVLEDLAHEYSKLDSTDIRRTNLLSSVGGKLRANALNAILENYDMYSKMLDEYAQGAGSMAAEAEKTATSWEGSMNRVSNTWTKTVNNIANSDGIIAGINILNSLLSIIDTITNKLGSFGTIGLGAGVFAGLKNVGRPRMFGLYCS